MRVDSSSGGQALGTGAVGARLDQSFGVEREAGGLRKMVDYRVAACALAKDHNVIAVAAERGSRGGGGAGAVQVQSASVLVVFYINYNFLTRTSETLA